MMSYNKCWVVVILLASASLSVSATPEYKADIPANVTTADSVKTKYAGELTLVDGFPTDDNIWGQSKNYECPLSNRILPSAKSVLMSLYD